MSMLASLYLASNQIGDKGAEHLSKAIPYMKALDFLCLCGNDLSSDGNGAKSLNEAWKQIPRKGRCLGD